uniref:Uncharacterized protein n=1 Tax=Tetranychus urticae TaxID=32264 RepID=T1KXF9_TETUR
MDSVEMNKNFVETDLSDSMILIQDEAEAALNPSDVELCKVYHSCCLHDHDLMIKNEDVSNEDVEESEEDENVQEYEDDKGQEDEGEAGETLVNLDEEEYIELQRPEWTEEKVHNQESDSDCESKSTNVTSLDDSLVATSSQQQLNVDQLISKNTAELTLTDNTSDLDDKTDLSSTHGLDEEIGEDTVDSGPVSNDYNEETVGLLSEQSELGHNITNTLDNDQLIKDKLEIQTKAILINLTDPLAGKRDDQMSLVTKHSTQLYRHANYSGISSYTASTTSTSSSNKTQQVISSVTSKAKRARKAVVKQMFSLLKKAPKHFK